MVHYFLLVIFFSVTQSYGKSTEWIMETSTYKLTLGFEKSSD